MAKVYGRLLAAAKAILAPGTVHDAGVRRYKNDLDFAVNGGGGTQNTPVIARVREGSAIFACEISSTVNLAGINFTLGTAAAPAKYATAFAGPAAGATVRVPILPAMLAADALEKPEELILTPSANLPGAGILVASVFASHR